MHLIREQIMFKGFYFFIALILVSVSVSAEIPDPSTDSLTIEANFDEAGIYWALTYANSHCRHIWCGSQSTFLYVDHTGSTRDGEIASIWFGRWIPETMTASDYLIWNETVYLEMWTGLPPNVDYSAASAVIHGVPWWSFVDQVLEAANANQKAKVELTTTGWYGVHLDDAYFNHTASVAEITIIATVEKSKNAAFGDVVLTYTAQAK